MYVNMLKWGPLNPAVDSPGKRDERRMLPTPLQERRRQNAAGNPTGGNLAFMLRLRK